jgi:hypothetical protein
MLLVLGSLYMTLGTVTQSQSLFLTVRTVSNLLEIAIGIHDTHSFSTAYL